MTKGFPFVAHPGDLRSRNEVLSRPCPVPSEPGVYAWYFRRVPAQIDVTGCHAIGGMTLLYVGISPKEPPANGRTASRSTLRKRLQTHYRGNAEGSTLRKTLGCLLALETGFPLTRVGSGIRQTFTNPGEQALDAWMSENAFVAWHACDQPWEVEREILGSGLPLPLNIRDNPCEAHTAVVRAVRRAAVAAALDAPIVTDSGGARRKID
jgi:hypothetical protein